MIVLRRVAQLVDAKAAPDEAAGYKGWLLEISGRWHERARRTRASWVTVASWSTKPNAPPSPRSPRAWAWSSRRTPRQFALGSRRGSRGHVLRLHQRGRPRARRVRRSRRSRPDAPRPGPGAPCGDRRRWPAPHGHGPRPAWRTRGRRRPVHCRRVATCAGPLAAAPASARRGRGETAGEGIEQAMDRSPVDAGPGQRGHVGREDEDAHVVTDELADPGCLHRPSGEGLLVVAHDQAGRVGIGQPRTGLAQRGQQVGLVLGPSDPGGREGPVSDAGHRRGCRWCRR